MNAKLLLVISMLACGAAKALPEGQTLANLNWDTMIDGTPAGLRLPPEVTGTIENPTQSENPSVFELKIQYTGTLPLQLKLLPTPQSNDLSPFQNGFSRIVTHHYAITGQISYENVSSGSYLEMWSYFDSPAPGYPEGAYFSRTMADGGPMGKLEGTSDWREFWLPFDSTGSKTKLHRLEMNLRLTGPGTVHLRNMKLVQYPDAPVSPAPLQPTATAPVAAVSTLTAPSGLDQAALTAAYLNAQSDLIELKAKRDALVASGLTLNHPAVHHIEAQIEQQQSLFDALQSELKTPQASALDWKSFLLGVAATCLALLGVTGLIFVSRLWQRRHHERELRRIASLDS